MKQYTAFLTAFVCLMTAVSCGKQQEKPDYEDLCRGHDTTLEGLAHLRDRIEAHSDDCFY